MSFVSNVGRLPTSGQYASKHRQQVRDGGGRFAGGWGVAWQGLEGIADSVLDVTDKLMEDIKQGAENLKDEMVQYMKTHAVWEDQTGNAREGLQGTVVWEDDTHFTIMLGHGADIYYGIWLEVRYGGRFAIVTPTVQQFAPQMGAKIIGGRG